jgi:hypothetical protein
VIGAQRRAAILDALRRGTVPREGLAAFAVGMERFEAAVDADLAVVAGGRGAFKAVGGEYGSGKTFMARWLQERARTQDFATSEVQVNETETPLDRWEAVYRRLVERLATSDTSEGALRSTVDAWFYTLEEDVLAEGRIDANNSAAGGRHRNTDGAPVDSDRTNRACFLGGAACLSSGVASGRPCAFGRPHRLAGRSAQCRGCGEARGGRKR